jgi:hypothetical protein
MGTGAAQSRCLKLAAAHDVIAGNPKSILRMYVLEGANARADRKYRDWHYRTARQ